MHHHSLPVASPPHVALSLLSTTANGALIPKLSAVGMEERIVEDDQDSILIIFHNSRPRGGCAVLRAICPCTAVCHTEAEKEEMNKPGTMGEFRALWRLTLFSVSCPIFGARTNLLNTFTWYLVVLIYSVVEFVVV